MSGIINFSKHFNRKSVLPIGMPVRELYRLRLIEKYTACPKFSIHELLLIFVHHHKSENYFLLLNRKYAFVKLSKSFTSFESALCEDVVNGDVWE